MLMYIIISISAIVHIHVDHLFPCCCHLVVYHIVPHLPLDCRPDCCRTAGCLRSISCCLLSFFWYQLFIILIWMETHIRKGTVQESQTSELGYHFILIVSDWHGGNSDLDFDYVSDPEPCWIYLRKPGHKMSLHRKMMKRRGHWYGSHVVFLSSPLCSSV
jgi:hypothetical protein